MQDHENPTTAAGPWLPFFRETDVTTIGEEWPTYLIEKWERNDIGEQRFTGEVRTYGADTFAACLASPAFHEALAAALDNHEPPTKSNEWVRHERGDSCPHCDPAIIAAMTKEQKKSSGWLGYRAV